MVGLHVWMKPYGKPDAPQGAGMQVRYLKREGEFSPAHYMARSSKRTKDYTDFVEGGTQHLPRWANNDPARFFREAARYERQNGYYMFQVQFSLPRELTHEQQQALRQDFMDATMADLPAMWVMHNKQLESGEMHPHMHILLSARKVDGIERDPAQTFQRWNGRVPAEGGCEKDLFWSQRQAQEQLRQAFADISNYHLERARVEARVDPRSLKRRGIKRAAIGRGSVRPDAATLAKEQAKAVATWEQRKAYRGLANVHDIPREEMVLLVRQWTRQYERGRQLPRVSTAEVIAWEEKERQRVTQEREALERHLSEIERAQRGELRAHELLALLRRGDEPVRQGLRARLFEDEQPGYRY